MKLPFFIFSIFTLSLIILGSDQSFADSNNKENYITGDYKIIKSNTPTCTSFIEFSKTYEFLTADKDLQLNEIRSMRLAAEVSKGCTDAFKRFAQVYSLLKKSGVAMNKAVEVGLAFSQLENQRAINFSDVFQKVYLENYFNFDFPTAYKIAFELSKDVKNNVEKTRIDFDHMVKFCIANDKMSLPLNLCAEMVLQIAKYSPLYDYGMNTSFEDAYLFLRHNKHLNLNIKDTVRVLPEILAYGPMSFMNFKHTFQYATTSEKLKLNERLALDLALKVAKNSLPKDYLENEFNSAEKK